MAEKYADLEKTITDLADDVCSDYDNGVADTLRWLDGHPDQTPNLTMTETEFAEHVEWRPTTWQAGFRFAMAYFGVVYVPEPKSENARRLDAILEDWQGQVTAGDDPTLGEFLESRGVIVEESSWNT